MSDALTIVENARGWLGTRFAHQGRRRACGSDGGGVDCLGLLVGVAAECKLTKDGRLLAAYDELDYGHFPDEVRLFMALKACLHEVEQDDVRTADVLLLKIDGRAQHVGIVGEYAGGGLSLIHAYAPARRVVEHRLDAAWRQKMVAVFRWHCSSSN